MFIKAIETVNRFTRPLHSISRNYGGLISPGASTLFFVNEEGVAITCKHVANHLLQADNINNQFNLFKTEQAKLSRDTTFKKGQMGLEAKYKYKKESVVQIKNNFVNCFDSISGITYHMHPELDLAILVFQGFNSIHYDSFATFVSDSNKIKQGQYLCRLGYPFPEFNNFRHNPQNDDIEWTNEGIQVSPGFPIDGIITRLMGNINGSITGIEMSTPGLKGQSGGPLFDTNGLVYGMQFQTGHLHLGFDLKDHEVIINGVKNKVSNSPFLHVGHCIHADKIKEFLTQHNIKFYQE
ncbi:MAG: serine protease [Bacteroidota bacterium]